MISQRIMELMNQEIDGVNSPAESRELQDHLADHPESRRLLSELTEAVGIFDKVTPLVPPLGLHDRILASTEAFHVPARKDWRAGLRDIFGPVLRPAVAASFALGLLAGFLVLEGYRSLGKDFAGTDSSHLQGMAGHGRDTLSSAPVVVQTLTGPRVSGQLSAQASGAHALIALEITSEETLTVQLVHHDRWSSTGFRTLAGRTGDLRVTTNKVVFETSGAGRWEINLLRTHGNEPVIIQIYHKGELVTEQAVTVKP